MTALGDRLRWLADEVDAGHPMMSRFDTDEVHCAVRADDRPAPVGHQLRSIVYTVVVELPPPLVP